MALDSGLSCEEIIVEGDPVVELPRISREAGVDLLVIGSIGLRGPNRFLWEALPKRSFGTR